MTNLTIAVADYGHTVPIKDGTIKVPGIQFDVAQVKPIIGAYRRMVRDLEFDVCELAPTTYLLAKENGAPFTALPLFLYRTFHHGQFQCSVTSGIREPSDFVGKRFGIRAYTVTTALWMRGILRHEYGVDTDSITYVTDDEEHVPTYRPPANVIAAPPGRSLAQMLADGELDAAIGGAAGTGRAGPPVEGWNAGGIENEPEDKRPYSLFVDPVAVAKESWERTGIYPIHALLVVKDEVLAAHPSLASDLYNAFVEAKLPYLRRLQETSPVTKHDQQFSDLSKIVGYDMLPYGLEENRVTIEAMIHYALEQQIITKPVRADDVFVPVTGS